MTGEMEKHPFYRVGYPKGEPVRVDILEPMGPNGEPGLVVEYWPDEKGGEKPERKYVLPPAVMVAAFTPDGHAITAERPVPGFDGLQLVSGTFKMDDRDPIVVAERALLAKTGYKGKSLVIASDFENTKRGTRRWYYVVITDCEVVSEPTEKGSTRKEWGGFGAVRGAIIHRYLTEEVSRGHNSLIMADLAVQWWRQHGT